MPRHERELMPRWEASYCPEPNTGCWLWEKLVSPRGYGLFSVRFPDGKFRNDRANRVSWRIYVGPIPEGMFVLHRCDTPACVNPGHLWLGTHDDNMRDCAAKGRTKGQKTTMCPSGHPYDLANTGWRPTGSRWCKACARIADKNRCGRLRRRAPARLADSGPLCPCCENNGCIGDPCPYCGKTESTTQQRST